MLLCQKENLSL